MPHVKQRVHMPAELMEVIFNGSCPSTQECAQLRLVDREWRRAIDMYVKRLRIKDLGKHANWTELIKWLQQRFPGARVLDLSKSYPCQLLLSPDFQKSQILRIKHMLVQLSTWPYEYVLRAGVRSLATSTLREMLAEAPGDMVPRVAGLSLFKDYKTYLPPPVSTLHVYGVRRFGQNIEYCLRSFKDQLQELSFEHMEVPTLEDVDMPYLCKHLTSLTFNGGVLKVVPTKLQDLKHMKVLKLDNCHLKVHGQAQLQKFPRGLESLTISHSHLAVNIHPQDLIFAKTLTHLDLSHNKIGALPTTIGQLQNLQYLNAGHNSLVSIPKAVIKLRYLRQLHLPNNKIKYLARDIDQLYWLEVLDVSYNAIVVFPKRFPKLYRLRILDIRGNSVRVPVPKEFLRYLRRDTFDKCLYDAYIAPPRYALQHKAPPPELQPCFLNPVYDDDVLDQEDEQQSEEEEQQQQENIEEAQPQAAPVIAT